MEGALSSTDRVRAAAWTNNTGSVYAARESLCVVGTRLFTGGLLLAVVKQYTYKCNVPTFLVNLYTFLPFEICCNMIISLQYPPDVTYFSRLFILDVGSSLSCVH